MSVIYHQEDLDKSRSGRLNNQGFNTYDKLWLSSRLTLPYIDSFFELFIKEAKKASDYYTGNHQGSTGKEEDSRDSKGSDGSQASRVANTFGRDRTISNIQKTVTREILELAQYYADPQNEYDHYPKEITPLHGEFLTDEEAAWEWPSNRHRMMYNLCLVIEYRLMLTQDEMHSHLLTNYGIDDPELYGPFYPKDVTSRILWHKKIHYANARAKFCNIAESLELDLLLEENRKSMSKGAGEDK